MRARRQARTRAAIVAAAIELFSENGYDSVTVNDIAARADVGRTTFFRYFKDKSDVLFADDAELGEILVSAAEQAARANPFADGDPLVYGLVLARAGIRAVTARVAEYGDLGTVYDRLISGHDGLLGRSLVKHQQYMADLAAVLRRHRVPAQTAVLAAQVALACYRAAQTAAGSAPHRLVATLDDAFDRLLTLGAAPAAQGSRRRVSLFES